MSIHIQYAAIDDGSKYIGVAGIYGYAVFSLSRRKWKLFGNETQEKNVICRGGLTWWNNILIVGCYNFTEQVDEVICRRYQQFRLPYFHLITPGKGRK